MRVWKMLLALCLTVAAVDVYKRQIMITVGWKYATGIGSKGFYTSMPKLSKFWQYLPIPTAGVAMLVFEIEALYNHIKSICVKEEK